MGRDALFNTGLEYRFVFAHQDSADILLFSSQEPTMIDQYYYELTWGPKDAELCDAWLRWMELKHGITRPDMSKYPANVNGSHDILWDARDLKVPHAYPLELCILHQLQYQPDLSVRFEV